MRNFLTILAAGAIATLAIIMMPAAANAQSGQYALEIILEEDGVVFDAPKVVVEPGKKYTLVLNAAADYDFEIDIAANTREAAMKQFDRDLGRWARDFLLVNTKLSFEERPEAQALPDYGKSITSNLLLRVAEPQREIRSDIDVTDRGLVTRKGEKIETLSIIIKAVPFQ
jgi:hypothetical protein